MLDPRSMMSLAGVRPEQLAQLQALTRRIKATVRVHPDRLEVRFSPQDQEAAGAVPGLVESLADQFAATLYTYLGMAGEKVRVK